MNRKQATVAEIEAVAAEIQSQVGSGFRVAPNRVWVRIECLTCHESHARDQAVQWALEHHHGQTCDFVTSDGNQDDPNSWYCGMRRGHAGRHGHWYN